ncbi:DUF3426 domain-containing protein [Vogesella oryzae]|uniref:DUF3426 domain-containing protein n=1 Tax=Vogesella oryzae TaxID=1735285 RepID=UPI0015840F79|nr:DUF3426 domain-containing protein [Vogesella oryzae]
MSHTTQCPTCQTKFKVTDAHLALAGGMVRCGRCNHVFHAPSYFDNPPAVVERVAPAPKAPEPPLRQAEDDDFELELPDFEPEIPTPEPTSSPASPQAQPQVPQEPAPVPATPAASTLPSNDEEDFSLPEFDLLREREIAPPARAAEIRQDFRSAARDAESDGRQQLEEFQQALADALRPQHHAETAATPLAANPFDTDEAEEQATPSHSIWTEPPEPDAITTAVIDDNPADTAASKPWWRTALLSLLAIILLLLLLAQILFINRTRASAEMPELRPVFESVCQVLHCSVPLPSERQMIRTEWSELAFVPDNDRLIQLNATLKNLAPYPQQLPLMEVTLKNANDQIMMRKVLRPQEYLKRQDYQLGQFNANSELKLQLRMEVAGDKAQGYSLDFFYP